MYACFQSRKRRKKKFHLKPREVYDIVWDVVINKIPELQQAVEHILRQEDTH
jgi:uncharacterized protein with HEPN domain